MRWHMRGIQSSCLVLRPLFEEHHGCSPVVPLQKSSMFCIYRILVRITYTEHSVELTCKCTRLYSICNVYTSH